MRLPRRWRKQPVFKKGLQKSRCLDPSAWSYSAGLLVKQFFSAFGEFLLACPQKEPKSLGKHHRSAGFAWPAHNNLYYRWVDTLGLQSFFEWSVIGIICLIHLYRTRDMCEGWRRWIADVSLRWLNVIVIEYRQLGAGLFWKIEVFCVVLWKKYYNQYEIISLLCSTQHLSFVGMIR